MRSSRESASLAARLRWRDCGWLIMEGSGLRFALLERRVGMLRVRVLLCEAFQQEGVALSTRIFHQVYRKRPPKYHLGRFYVMTSACDISCWVRTPTACRVIALHNLLKAPIRSRSSHTLVRTSRTIVQAVRTGAAQESLAVRDFMVSGIRWQQRRRM
jgi:hypothetical protein